MENRGAWVLAGLGLALVALLAVGMGKMLDSKAPIRIERRTPVATVAVPVEPGLPAWEEAAREEEAMRALVAGRARVLAPRAAEQAFPAEDAARVRCTFTEARLVHREESVAYWSAGFSCTDPRDPGALPNLTSVSVRLRRDGTSWATDE